MGHASLLRWAPLLVPMDAGDSTWGRGLQWRPHPLYTTQQWHPASVEAWASSTHIPSCGAPSSHPFRLSLHSQQLFPPWVCSPNPTFQRPAPIHTSRHVSGCGAQGYSTDHPCRSYCVLPATDWLLCSPLSPQSSPSVPAAFPTSEGASQCAGTSPLLQFPHQGRWSHPISSFLFVFLLSYLVTQSSFLSFLVSEVLCWCSAGIL